MGGTVQCVGAALAVVVATSAQVARQAARKVLATYEPLRDEQVGLNLLPRSDRETTMRVEC